MPSIAFFLLFSPSKENGLVTIAIVKAPKSLATCATIGAAPVPVPPPIPAAIKTIFAPCNISYKSSIEDSAAA